MAKKCRYYGVRVGWRPGIYSSWCKCEKQIKGYSGAEYKSFDSREEAIEYLYDGMVEYDYKTRSFRKMI